MTQLNFFMHRNYQKNSFQRKFSSGGAHVVTAGEAGAKDPEVMTEV
jgi:hypothetical protein